MEPTNKDRAQWAEIALIGFQEAKREEYEATEDEISDLITDLLHLAKQKFNSHASEIINWAKDNYLRELEEQND